MKGWLCLLVLLLQHAMAAALNFSPQELRLIGTLGPWPAPAAADPGNRYSGDAAVIALGRALFADQRLSPDARFACATCHQAVRHFSDGRPRALGRVVLARNTPSIVDAGHQRWWGWDGASDSLWSQAHRALQAADEMAATPVHLQALLQRDAGLRQQFVGAFGEWPHEPTATTVLMAKALGAFVATLRSGRSPFDDFRDATLRNDAAAAAVYPENAQRGLRLFVGPARCVLCHSGAQFSNGEFADIGLPFFVRPGVVDPGRHGGISMLLANPMNLLGAWSDERTGAAAVKTRHVDLQHRNFGEFKVPSLRNVARTAPYMHDGQLASLAAVVRHYSEINIERLHADGERILMPLHLSASEQADLVAFLVSLSSRGAVRIRPGAGAAR